VTFPSCCPCVLAVTGLDLHIPDSSKHVNVLAFAYQHLIPAYWNSLTSQLLHHFNHYQTQLAAVLQNFTF